MVMIILTLLHNGIHYSLTVLVRGWTSAKKAKKTKLILSKGVYRIYSSLAGTVIHPSTRIAPDTTYQARSVRFPAL